jgi:putative flippase GtrA
MELIVNNIMAKIINFLRIEKYRQFIVFGFIGILNSLVDFSVFFLLKYFFNIHYEICFVAGYSAGTVNSFLLNKYLNFRNMDKGNKSVIQFSRFVILNLFSLGLSMLFMYLLVDIFDMNAYISKLLVIIITLVINFIGSKFWVFKKKVYPLN